MIHYPPPPKPVVLGLFCERCGRGFKTNVLTLVCAPCQFAAQRVWAVA